MVASQFVLEIHGGNPDWPLLLAAGARIHACPSEKNALQCCLMLLICTLVCHTYSCVSSQQSYKADWRDIIIPLFTEETNPQVTWLKPRGFSNQNLPSGPPPWEPPSKASYELNICVKPLCRVMFKLFPANNWNPNIWAGAPTWNFLGGVQPERGKATRKHSWQISFTEILFLISFDVERKTECLILGYFEMNQLFTSQRCLGGE